MKKAGVKSKIKKSETEPKQDVLAGTKHEPGARVADIGAFVKDWAATHKGGKWNVVHAAQWVVNLKSIAGGIEMKLPASQRPTDKEIAATAANQINLSSTMPKGTVGVTVHGGWITLEGEVESYYQKAYAENATEHLSSVKGVFTQITIKPALTSAQLETSTKSTFGQNAPLVAYQSQVEAARKVVLCGKVQSHAE